MEKYKAFFLKLKLLTNEQFHQLEKVVDFSISKDLNKDVILKIDFESLPDPELYFDLMEKTKQDHDGFKFDFCFDKCIYDYEIVSQYLIYYSQENKILSPIVSQILQRKDGEIKNNILIIYCLNLNEKKNLNQASALIEKYLKSCGINFLEIQFIFNEEIREMEMFREKKLKIDPKILESINKPRKKTEPKIYNAKSVNIKAHHEKIIDLIPEQTSAIIFAEIFSIDKMTTKNAKTIYRFHVTDYTSSIVLKFFPWSNSGLSEVIASLKQGMWIKCQVDLQIDQFEKSEQVGIIKALEIKENPHQNENVDHAEKKRIEFLAHTNMSAFEGINKFNDVVKRAIDFGHTAIGLTDKFNCQSFPSASFFQEKNQDKFNVMYGFQSNILENQCKAVINPIDQNLNDGKYVVFDIETTGLFPLVDDIIEFGAIKYENRQIVDEIQFFIKPHKSIPAKITEITKIDNEMVQNAMGIVAGLEKMIDFIGDYILIAHNGINFDLNFLNFKLEQYGFEQLRNPLIDTMVISRSVNEYKSHSLGSLCAKNKIDYSDIQAHRADFDAKVLLSVWMILLEKLSDKGINNLNEINEKILNKNLIGKSRPWIANLHCLNKKGIKKIYKLISKSLTTNLINYPFLWINDLSGKRKDLLFSNSPTEGDVWESSLYQPWNQLCEKIAKYDIIFVAPPSSFLHEIQRKNIDVQGIEKAIKRIYDAAKSLNKKVLASTEMYYVSEEDKTIFDIYVHTKSIGGKPHRLFSYNDDNSKMPEAFYKTTNALLEEFSFLGNDIAMEIVVDHPNAIALQFEKNIVPIKNQLHTPIIEGSDDNLRKLAKKTMYEIYGNNPDPYIVERLEWELSSIIDNGYGVIYWFSHLLVKMSNDDGFLVGSRGSIGSSFVAAMVNITDVNPLPPYYLCKACKAFKFVKNVNSGFDLSNVQCTKCHETMEGDGHNIPFEVFMGFKGDKVPDIDLNFSADYQAKAHNFIKKTFGEKHVFRAGTISTVAEKTAFGYVKNYFEITNQTNVPSAEINRLAKKCCDVKRTTGQHPGGIIVVPLEKDVYDFTPYNFPADDADQDWYTTHYAFESLHDALLKFDILGHDSPTVLKMLEQTTKYNPKLIPNHDDDVMAMFNNVESLGIKPENIFKSKVASFGIPEFGTRFVREMLEITKPKNFSDLVRISGLSHGTDVWNNNAKDLIIKHNIDISEVISCRDDIMVYLQEKAVDPLMAFKIMEDVRKGKGLLPEYIEAMQKAKIPEWYVESCQKIKYLFPKAHATAYVDMAWKIAWYKKYYPLHFYASYLSIRISVFDLEAISKGKDHIRKRYDEINNLLKNPQTKNLVKSKDTDLLTIYEILIEMMERGYKFKMVDLLESKESDFIIGNDFLIPPFSIVPGLGTAAAKSIIEARKIKNFSSKQDLLSRTKINKTILKIFEEYGILNDLPESDQLKLF